MSEPRASAAVPLHCLGGQPAPAEVALDWQRLLALPDRAREQLWELVEPSLGAVDAALERRAEAFCRLYDVPAADLQASLRVCRFLLTRAGALDLSAERVAEDMAALSGGGAAPAASALLGHYDAARAVVRRHLVEQTILEHGKLLTGLDWRVDRIAGSDRGANLDVPLVVLTLRLREGERDERTTFYVTPEAFLRLKEAWARIEGALAGAGP